MQIEHKQYPNNYKYIEINNNQAHAKIALQGGHIFHFQPHNQEPILWLSPKAIFEKGKAIRGGIPICFPWFGKNKHDTSLAQHGFARTELWSVVSVDEKDENNTYICLELTDNKRTLVQWNYHFKLHLEITIGSALTLKLTTYNIDTKPFGITTALHSYFDVSDISKVSVKGLDGCRYLDSLTNKYSIQKDTLTIDKEVDRIYFEPLKIIELYDTSRTLLLTSSGSNSLVIWNPWIEKSESMADMSDDGYKTMLCLETGSVDEDFRVVEPDNSCVLKVVIRELF